MHFTNYTQDLAKLKDKYMNDNWIFKKKNTNSNFY